MLRRMVLAAVAAIALGAASQPAQAGIIGDIVLVLDESGSINSTEFQQERQFANNLIVQLPFGPTEVQLGIAMFSTVARNVIPLTPSQPTAINAINSVTQQGGGTNYNLGIDRGLSILFNQANARTGVPKIMIFLSDGADFADPMLTDASIANMNALGVVTLSIGVGLGNCQACVDRLIDVANGDPNHFFNVSNFGGLGAILPSLLMVAMQETTPPPPPPTDVAEPAMLALFGLGLVGLGCAALSRRTRAAA